MIRFTHVIISLGMGTILLSLPSSANAHDGFSFGLSTWGPPPIFIGRPCCYDPYYPPPVVYRRVYAPPPRDPAYAPSAYVPAKRAKAADPVLVKIGELHSDDSDVREDAAKWLGATRDPRGVRPLIEVLQHDRKDDVREDAARALGEIGGIEAEQALTTASSVDPDNDVRRAAAKSLSKMAKAASKKTWR